MAVNIAHERGSTSFQEVDEAADVLAHRLSTITHADQIVLIENGDIKEIGTHEQLIKEGGAYFRLFNVQNLNGVE